MATDQLDGLFETHHQRLYRLARRLSSTPEEAADLVQDAFLRAAVARHSLPRTTEQQEAWLVRVLVNLCRDRWRQAATRRRLQAVLTQPLATGGSNPESATIARAVVWQALNALPPKRRAVVIMHELEGESVAAIARLLGVTSVTVRWHLAAGRRQLARTFGATRDGA
jgi:RNA polymerase sigma-70 factor (ECF subfamily)